MDAEPLQRDHCHGVDDPAFVQPPKSFVGGDDNAADVLVLLAQAVDAAAFRCADPSAVDEYRFRRGAGADQIVADGDNVADLAVGLLDGLAARHIFRFLARLDDAGDAFDEPRRGRVVEPRRGQRGIGAGPELLNKHQHVAVGIEEQDGDRVAALEDFAFHLAAPAAVEELVPQAIAVDPEIALEGGGFFDDLDVVGIHGAPAIVALARPLWSLGPGLSRLLGRFRVKELGT